MKLPQLSVAMLAISAMLLTACSTEKTLQKSDLQAAKPVRLILVGDSTMAANSGYGNAFCHSFNTDVTCLNLAKGGRSSSSYRAEGSWANVQKLLDDKSSFRQTLVLIQFGHNDQPGKPGRSTDLATEFPVNMARYVDEVQAAGAQAVVVTPLTRRSFKGAELQNDLNAWAAASIAVAGNKHVPVIDLNSISYRAVQAMGQAQADTLAMAPPPEAQAATSTATETAKTERAGAAKSAFDRTHLGSKGAGLFSAMVVKELLAVFPALRVYLNPEIK